MSTFLRKKTPELVWECCFSNCFVLVVYGIFWNIRALKAHLKLLFVTARNTAFITVRENTKIMPRFCCYKWIINFEQKQSFRCHDIIIILHQVISEAVLAFIPRRFDPPTWWCLVKVPSLLAACWWLGPRGMVWDYQLKFCKWNVCMVNRLQFIIVYSTSQRVGRVYYRLKTIYLSLYIYILDTKYNCDQCIKRVNSAGLVACSVV